MVEREVEEPGSGTLTWYINGLKDATKSLDLASNLAWEERTMWIGSDRGVSGFFTGWFDELKISEGVQYGGDFDKPTTLSARWDTYALYHFDSGAGWVYNVAPTSAQPIVVEGATPTVDFTSPVAGCP